MKTYLEEVYISMEKNRAGEFGRTLPPRSDRFFAARGDWYFTTREGAPVGPYDNKTEAVRGLDDFIEFMSLAEPKTLSRLYAALTA
jgi:Domain of unknown function (DUF6316)